MVIDIHICHFGDGFLHISLNIRTVIQRVVIRVLQTNWDRAPLERTVPFTDNCSSQHEQKGFGT